MKRVSNWFKQELQTDRKVLRHFYYYALKPLLILLLIYAFVRGVLEEFDETPLYIGVAFFFAIKLIAHAWDQHVALKREELDLKRKEINQRKDKVA